MATKKKVAKATKKAAPKKKSSSPAKSAQVSVVSPKAMFLTAFTREHATSAKVLRAMPPGQGEFRPHPRSQSVRQLAFTMVGEQRMISLALRDQLKLGGGWPKAPDDFGMILDQFESDYNALVEQIKTSPTKAFEGTVDFPVGPGKVAPWPKMDFLYMMLSDQIHHRGQLSVYLRMAGGKVPAIYGPSADEPWF
jgi:uncharacterized damage-inducible protein DinB